MSTPQIQSALSEMQALATQAGGADKGARVTAQVGGGDFADTLHGAIERINQLQQASGDQSRAFQAGESGVSLHDVMIDGQKSSVAFEMGVQVRNRLVNAYKDVMNMPV